MLHLPEVTLVCIDTANHRLALRALARSCSDIRYARALLLTDRLPDGVEVPQGVDVVAIERIPSRDAYSRFVLKDLLGYVTTDHVLLVQWDGYVVNPDAWDPAFLECDYLGACWFWLDEAMRVGNGGFSLRSRRLLEALRDPRIDLVEAEDVTIGRAYRPLLERDHGIRFGSEALADRFSFEADHPVGRPFGFHGLFNFWRVMKAGELATLPPLFSDPTVRSEQFDQLLHNCLNNGLWMPAVAIARRILEVEPDQAEIRALLDDAEANLARVVDVRDDDPCPCGSGKKHAACHGAAGASSLLEPQWRSPTPDEFVRRGIALHQAGELIGADREYRAALVLQPAHPYALHNRGLACLQRGRLAEAVALLERAQALYPHEVEFRHSFGQALAAAGRVDEGIEQLRQVVAQAPGHAVAWYNLGEALRSLQKSVEAVVALETALLCAPGFAQAETALTEMRRLAKD